MNDSTMPRSKATGKTAIDAIRRPVHLASEVASYVRELILSGQVRGGEALNIDQLARDLDISATPVREALLSLRGEGFVDFEPRRGFRTSQLGAGDVQDLYWAQAQIAGELTARAALAATPELIAELRTLQASMRAALERGDPDELEALNHAFHRTVHLAAESPKLAWLLSVALRYAPRRFYLMIAGWTEASITDHDAILEAIATGDSEKARLAMADHIINAGELLVANLHRQGFWSGITGQDDS